MEHEIISRAEAKEQGLKFYFTGKPCSRGGIGKRRTVNCDCCCDECTDTKSAYLRDHYETNKDRIIHRVAERSKNNKEKLKDYNRHYRKENSAKIAEVKRRFYQLNKIEMREKGRKRRETRKAAIANQQRLWREKNPDKALANSSKRRAAKRERIPAWFGELDQFVLEEAYDLAIQRKELTGIEWHIDHMVPLRARKASGLHCADNIQVIPAAMNLSKRNKMVLTQPLEWLR